MTNKRGVVKTGEHQWMGKHTIFCSLYTLFCIYNVICKAILVLTKKVTDNKIFFLGDLPPKKNCQSLLGATRVEFNMNEKVITDLCI